MTKLDIEAVHAFVLVADLKSFTRAAQALTSTQSAVSLKIKRLENELGQRLFDRTTRLVRLSSSGNSFLESARSLLQAHQAAIASVGVKQRRIVIGISHNVVGAELSTLIDRMNSFDTRVVMDIRMSTSRLVLDEFERGMSDAAIVLRHDDRRPDGEVILKEEFGWMGIGEFEHRPAKPLPLAIQPEHCSIRAMALATLDDAGISWTEAFIGNGIATIGPAILTGRTIAPLGRRVAPSGTLDLGPRLGLPRLPSRDIVLHSRASDSDSRGLLRNLVAAIRSTAGRIATPGPDAARA